MKPVSIVISFLILLSILLVAAGCTQPASGPAVTVPSTTPQSSSKEAMVAFVKEAVAYAHTHEKNATLAEFSNPNGSFVRGDLYIYAYDFNGTTIAHPFSPEKLGVSRINEPDALGTLFITNLRNAAVNGSGFAEFSYKNPANRSIVEKKLGYVEKVDDDWWLGSGIYYGPVGPVTSSGNNTAASPSRTG
jgi:signal transduction histidine kinase